MGKPRGIGIIDLVVGIGLFVVASFLIWQFESSVFGFNATAYDSMSEEADALKFINTWASEVRSMQPGETGAYPIVTSATNSMIFYSDYDGDGTIERIHYYRSGNTLKKGIIEPTVNPPAYHGTEVSVDEVHDLSGLAPIFEYYDDSYNGSATATPLVQPVNNPDIRLVKMTLTVDHLPGRPPGPIQVTTQVTMRNLKDNL
jgi:hypothetical protein